MQIAVVGERGKMSVSVAGVGTTEVKRNEWDTAQIRHAVSHRQGGTNDNGLRSLRKTDIPPK